MRRILFAPRGMAFACCMLLVFVCAAFAQAHVQAQAQAQAQTQADVIAEIRIHGNYATTDADVIRLSGVSVGQPLAADAVDAVAKRLRASGRFQSVDVRKRLRSLTDPTQVALIIIVQEFPTSEAGDITPPNPIRRLREKLMFLPIVSYADGYGLTYGGRASFVHLLGRDGRVSVPLTWGGMKRAAVEIEKTFSGGPISRLDGGASISRRENPYFRIDDDRQELWAHADRRIAGDLRVGASLGWTDVSFAALDDRFVRYGLDVTYDTRRDPVFPRNAVYARVGWDALDFRAHPTVHRTSLEGRAYAGVFGQNVVSVRARYDGADGPLPAYEQALLGGASTLRGFRAGSFVGDNRLVSSIELRMPISSPLNAGKAGVDIFLDSGTVYDDGQKLRHARFRHGIGAGLFFSATIFQINADIAYGLDKGPGEGRSWRFHLMSGFQF
jgi:outer membrane protein assembly factor BamA